MRPKAGAAASRLALVLLVASSWGRARTTTSSWDEWWSYDGFSGPDFWGLVNPEWRMCSRGQHQSPVDVDPSLLLFDPHLRPVEMSRTLVNGHLVNTGQLLSFVVQGNTSDLVTVTGGPLGPYTYRIQRVVFHFGLTDGAGSEHTIDGDQYPGEIQLLGYNSDLYSNFDEAVKQPRGLVGIAVIVASGHNSSHFLKQVTNAISDVLYKGKRAVMRTVSLSSLLQHTDSYVTYEGSLTTPGCYETVTWIVLNKPLYIRASDLKRWRDVRRTEESDHKGFLGDNYRKVKSLNQRLLRTNINIKTQGKSCPRTFQEFSYRANHQRKSNRLDGEI